MEHRKAKSRACSSGTHAAISLAGPCCVFVLVSLAVDAKAFASARRGDVSFPSSLSPESKAATLSLPTVSQEDRNLEAEGDSHLVPSSLMFNVLSEAIEYASMDAAALDSDGWKLVHDVDMFKLWKRKTPARLYEYLMIGHVEDVTPRHFLAAQLDKTKRVQWDTSMSEMEYLTENSSPPSAVGLESGHPDAEDTLYYRTKWPWPLKDRDYVLARRCRQYDNKRALVFVSRSTEPTTPRPTAKGAIRVENYWCHSTFLAAPTKENHHSVKTKEDIDVSQEQPEDSYHDQRPIKAGNVERKVPGVAERFGRVRFAIGKCTDQNGGRNQMKKKKVGFGSMTTQTGLDAPGTTFVTRFCDDSKVPLPSSIVEKIAKIAEAQVPPSMQRLYECARKMTESVPAT